MPTQNGQKPILWPQWGVLEEYYKAISLGIVFGKIIEMLPKWSIPFFTLTFSNSYGNRELQENTFTWHYDRDNEENENTDFIDIEISTAFQIIH